MEYGNKKWKKKKPENKFILMWKNCFSYVSVSHSKVFIPKGDNSILGKTRGMEDCHSIHMILNNILMRNWIAKPKI